MKPLKQISVPLLLLLCMVGVNVSCSNNDDDDLIWDIYPLEIIIQVVDKDGNNLMDPNNEHNILESGITATFMGETYPLYDINNYKMTRAYMPIPYGLVYRKFYGSNQYFMYFGELDGTVNINKESLVIDWNDGTQNVIVINRHFKWKKNQPQVKEKIWLDGEEVKSRMKIVK